MNPQGWAQATKVKGKVTQAWVERAHSRYFYKSDIPVLMFNERTADPLWHTVADYALLKWNCICNIL